MPIAEPSLLSADSPLTSLTSLSSETLIHKLQTDSSDFETELEHRKLLHQKQKMVSKKIAVMEQLAPNKILTMTAGDLTPAELCSFEIACRTYFSHHHDIPPEERVEKVAWGI